MNKTDLEVKIESLRNMVLESQQQTSNYIGQLATIEQQLKDYNKIALPPMVFDEIYEAIELATSRFDFSDTDNFDIEYGIEYDGKVHCETHDFTNTTDLVEAIAEEVSKIFTEADCPEDTPEKVKYDDELNKANGYETNK